MNDASQLVIYVMSLTINGLIVGEISNQGVSLRPVLGAYELCFSFKITMNPKRDYDRCVTIFGARVSLSNDRGASLDVGFAQPEQPIELGQYDHSHTMTYSLIQSLQPGQLAELERIRDGENIAFRLQMLGVGTDEYGAQNVNDMQDFRVPRSEWIERLRNAGAKNILLLEVPVPLVDPPEEWAAAGKDLQQAVIHYQNGDYRSCVGMCRTVLDEIGRKKFDAEKDWATPLLQRLANDRPGMTRGEREAALWAAVRHYAHPAHHAVSDGGEQFYCRAEAKLILTTVAALVGFALSDIP